MKNIIAGLFILFITGTAPGQNKYGKPEVSPLSIQKKFADWSTYQKHHIRLSADFTALNIKSVSITKETFLKTLTTGEYIPVRLLSKAGLVYQLFKINPNSDTSIKATISQIAFDEFEHFKMEGHPFPEFNFTDLKGNVISNATMKGKIIIIKCWYIHCAECIREFPAVNELAARYRHRNDIEFVSLAEDTPEQLTAFLAQKPLAYAVVPEMKIYMNQTLKLNAFPTHFIINKKGIIVKVLSDVEGLKAALLEIDKQG